MKKILFCAGLVALATSCTQDETLSLDTQKASKGLTFEFVNGVDSRIQYDKEGTGSWKSFWYAEQDRITLWATGVTTQDWDETDSKWNAVTVTEGEWADFATDAEAVTYKATKSDRNAQFTSVDDENLLTGFNYDEETAKFLAVYPNNDDYTLSTGENGELEVGGALTNLAEQTISTSKGHNPAIVQLAHAEVSEHESYNSVGEKVFLQYSFATPVIKFGTEGLTDNYKTAFGNLKSVTLTMQGYDTEGTSDDIEASVITYTEPKILINPADWKHAIVEDGNAGAATIKATIGGVDGLEWSDDALAPIAVADVDRTAYQEAGVAETYTAVYEFANIELNAGGDSKVKTTSNSWNHGGNFLTVHLKMNEFSYLVTKTPTGETNSRTLFVIKGDFSDILTADGTAINWDDSETTRTAPVAFTTITKVVVESGVILDAEDFAVLNKMTNVKELVLTSNTSIPAEALKDLTGLKKLSMPAVTSVGAGAFTADLTHVYMPSYAFESKAINDMLLKAEHLVELDMSGATMMNAGFPAKGLLLSNFDKLNKVTVKDGVKVGSNAFEGCDVLTEIAGRLDIVGDAAMKNCPKLNNVIVSSKDIRKETFNGCEELANVYYMDAETALVPNEVKDYAFNETKVDLDLSATTTIGEYAFAGNETMVGTVKDNDKNVVLVGAATIGANAFNGNTNIGYIYFKNATLVGDDILSDCTTLYEIKFGAKFAYSKAGENPSEDTFGPSDRRKSTIKLFHVKGQAGIESNVLTIGNADSAAEFEFYQITEEEAY